MQRALDVQVIDLAYKAKDLKDLAKIVGMKRKKEYVPVLRLTLLICIVRPTKWSWSASKRKKEQFKKVRSFVLLSKKPWYALYRRHCCMLCCCVVWNGLSGMLLIDIFVNCSVVVFCGIGCCICCLCRSHSLYLCDHVWNLIADRR